MKNYNVDSWRGIHTIRVTFMCEDYVGHIAYKVIGNHKGASLLNTNFLKNDTQKDIECYVENDCYFRYNEDYGCFSYVLRNSNGDTLEFIDKSPDDTSRYIVGIEIIDYQEKLLFYRKRVKSKIF